MRGGALRWPLQSAGGLFELVARHLSPSFDEAQRTRCRSRVHELRVGGETLADGWRTASDPAQWSLSIMLLVFAKEIHDVPSVPRRGA